MRKIPHSTSTDKKINNLKVKLERSGLFYLSEFLKNIDNF